MVRALVLLARYANDAQNEITRLTGSIPDIVTTSDERIINEIGRRGELLSDYIEGVYLKRYAVRFADGDLDIVSFNQEHTALAYPTDEIQIDGFGIAPIIVVAGIAAVTLLIAGDQAADRLEQQTKLEALKIQNKMIDADRYMATQPEPIRKQWGEWKESAATRAKEAAKNLRENTPWIERFLGKKGTAGLFVGLFALGGIAIALRELRK